MSPYIPERWQREWNLLHEKNYPVFHNSVDVEVIIALIEEVGALEQELNQLKLKGQPTK